MPSLEDFLFIRYDEKLPRSSIGYFEPPSAMVDAIIDMARHQKPICIIVPDDQFARLLKMKGVSIDRNQLGITVRCYSMPFSDTIIASEEYLTDAQIPDAMRNLVNVMMHPFVGRR